MDARSRCKLALFLHLLAGCASFGRDFREENLHLLHPGMPDSEVVKLLGAAPTTRVYLPDGSYVATWQYTAAFLTTVTDNKLVTLEFDANGEFVRVFMTVNAPPRTGN